MSAVLTAEKIKLELIKNQAVLAQQTKQAQTTPFSAEALANLIAALAFADKALRNDIEGFLVKCDASVLPQLMTGLLAENVHVRSTCAMALIRRGKTVLAQLSSFYRANAGNTMLKNTLELIYIELGAALPVS